MRRSLRHTHLLHQRPPLHWGICSYRCRISTFVTQKRVSHVPFCVRYEWRDGRNSRGTFCPQYKLEAHMDTCHIPHILDCIFLLQMGLGGSLFPLFLCSCSLHTVCRFMFYFLREKIHCKQFTQEKNIYKNVLDVFLVKFSSSKYLQCDDVCTVVSARSDRYHYKRSWWVAGHPIIIPCINVLSSRIIDKIQLHCFFFILLV